MAVTAKHSRNRALTVGFARSQNGPARIAFGAASLTGFVFLTERAHFEQRDPFGCLHLN